LAHVACCGRIGVQPVELLAQGIGVRTGLPIGVATFLVSVTVLLLWIPLRERPGLGTIANAVVIATALQVMDQRIINTSSVQCVGNTLLLQGRVYSPPFVITAVGPIRKMRESLRSDPGVQAYRDWAAAVGLGYEVTRTAELTIPGYEGPIAMTYATPSE